MYICLLFSGVSNVYHFACVWPTALKLDCITNFDMLFLVMGFISLVNEIQFMLISSRHICKVHTPVFCCLEQDQSTFWWHHSFKQITFHYLNIRPVTHSWTSEQNMWKTSQNQFQLMYCVPHLLYHGSFMRNAESVFMDNNINTWRKVEK